MGLIADFAEEDYRHMLEHDPCRSGGQRAPACAHRLHGRRSRTVNSRGTEAGARVRSPFRGRSPQSRSPIGEAVVDGLDH